MKITIKREFDGQYFIGSAASLPGCFVQARSDVEIPALMQKAIILYQRSYQSRNQSVPHDNNHSIINIKIRYKHISTEQLHKILKSRNFHTEYEDQSSLLMVNSEFPFDRVHLPHTEDVSPIIILKLFGKSNVTYVKPVKKNTARNAV